MSYAGTPKFMAPEFQNSQEKDNKIDMFSFGMVVFYMMYNIEYQKDKKEKRDKKDKKCFHPYLKNNNF